MYVRGALAYLDGDVVAPPGSGEFLPRSLGTPGGRSPRDAALDPPLAVRWLRDLAS